jgi:hypothetical protein
MAALMYYRGSLRLIPVTPIWRHCHSGLNFFRPSKLLLKRLGSFTSIAHGLPVRQPFFLT